MKYLVTGGCGFIGSHIVDKLINLGHEVVIIDDLSLGKETNIAHLRDNDKLLFCRQSICDDLDEIFEKGKFNAVFHVAALPRVQKSIQNPVETHHANVNGLLNVLDTCKKFSVKRIVFSSSSSIYGNQEKLPLVETMESDPISPYALHKLIGEYYCKQKEI